MCVAVTVTGGTPHATIGTFVRFDTWIVLTRVCVGTINARDNDSTAVPRRRYVRRERIYWSMVTLLLLYAKQQHHSSTTAAAPHH